MAAVAPFGSIEPYLIQAESGGNNVVCNLPGCPGVANPNGAPLSTAGGYFQITNSTWGGIPASITAGYPSAVSAPFDVQQSAANYLWTSGNGTAWLGTPGTSYTGNPNIIAANAALVAGQTPGMAVSSTVTGLVGGGATPTAASALNLPGLLNPTNPTVPNTAVNAAIGNAATAATSAAATAASGIATGIETWLGSIGGNVGIGILAVLLLVIAVWPDKLIAIMKEAAGG